MSTAGEQTGRTNRPKFLSYIGAARTLTAFAGAGLLSSRSTFADTGLLTAAKRRHRAFVIRRDAAIYQRDVPPTPSISNGDVEMYANRSHEVRRDPGDDLSGLLRSHKMQQLLLKFRVPLVMIVTIALAASSRAQATVVNGTGNPDVDVPAVQAAVNLGGEVVLSGHFSFGKPPTIPIAQDLHLPSATILISKAVVISGAGDVADDMTSIGAGTIPFYVDAPGASVTIHNLRFVRPTNSAIVVYAASGLTIASCRIEGLVPLPNPNSGIWIASSTVPPTPSQPGHPEIISGRILIANNDLDLTGGTADVNVLAITTFSAGVSPDREVDIYISGNRIRNVTQAGINLRRIGGRAHVEGNVITTGPVSSGTRPEAIRAANTGSYVIAHNVIDSQWPDPDAIGIGVVSQVADWPIEALVVDNEVTMSPPEGVLFGDFSAGIDIRGFAHGNVVGNNIVRGRARAAVAVGVFNEGIPGNTAFVLNRFEDFDASIAGVAVGIGVSDTLILGQKGTVNDQGMNTVILP